MATPLLDKFWGRVWTVPGNTCAKFEVRSFNRFELLAFNAEKFRGHVTLVTPLLEKSFGGNVRTVTFYFKSTALTVFELLAFNAQKITESRDHGHAPFWINFGGHVCTVPGNTCAKFEVGRRNFASILLSYRDPYFGLPVFGFLGSLGVFIYFRCKI